MTLRASLLQLLGFALGAAGVLALSLPLAGLAGLRDPVRAMALTSALAAAGLMGLSALLLRREGATLAALGLPLNRTRLREAAWGLALGVGLYLIVAALQSLAVAAPWRWQGEDGLRAAVRALPLAGAMVLFEELLFRGLLLRALSGCCGERAALLLSATLFGVYHLIGSQDWAIGALLRFLMPVFGGLLFGWAALRSRGLALPIGLHLGGNWVQLGGVGFGPVGEGAAALWQIPLDSAQWQQLVAPDLAARAPYLLALALAAWAVNRRTRR